VDERAQQDVLDPVRDAPEGEPEQGDPQHRREGRSRDPEALRDDRRERGGRQTRRAHPAGEPGRAGRHAQRPRRDQQPVAEAPGAEHVGHEERLGGRRHGEDREGGHGAVDRHLGSLAAVLGRREQAIGHLRAGIERDAELGCTVWRLHGQYRLHGLAPHAALAAEATATAHAVGLPDLAPG
jgi:hypothetical protein